MHKDTWNFFKKQPLFNCFINTHDPRVQGRCRHPFINILMITFLGIISGADGWQSIELFAKKRKRWLSRFLDLSMGIPSHYTLARVCALIKPDDFQNCFLNFSRESSQIFADDIINLDGKTIIGSSHKRTEKKAAHIISAFSAREKITLGAVKTPDKTNEIKGIPILLNKLNIPNTIVTIDAMGTQKGIANLIRKKQAHYVLALKENHKRFYRKVNRLFEKADELGFNAMVYKNQIKNNYDHGRIEEREYTVLPMMYLHQYKKDWKDLSIFIRVKSKRETIHKNETSTRYYISSVPYKKYYKAIEACREHWSIENTLHWKLDVGLHEDQCPIYRGYAPENLATIRKVVLFLLQKESSSKHGIAMKRLQAALSTQYLAKVAGL